MNTHWQQRLDRLDERCACLERVNRRWKRQFGVLLLLVMAGATLVSGLYQHHTVATQRLTQFK